MFDWKAEIEKLVDDCWGWMEALDGSLPTDKERWATVAVIRADLKTLLSRAQETATPQTGYDFYYHGERRAWFAEMDEAEEFMYSGFDLRFAVIQSAGTPPPVTRNEGA